jgi:hypothetical protein
MEAIYLGIPGLIISISFLQAIGTVTKAKEVKRRTMAESCSKTSTDPPIQTDLKQNAKPNSALNETTTPQKTDCNSSDSDNSGISEVMGICTTQCKACCNKVNCSGFKRYIGATLAHFAIKLWYLMVTVWLNIPFVVIMVVELLLRSIWHLAWLCIFACCSPQKRRRHCSVQRKRIRLMWFFFVKTIGCLITAHLWVWIPFFPEQKFDLRGVCCPDRYGRVNSQDLPNEFWIFKGQQKRTVLVFGIVAWKILFIPLIWMSPLAFVLRYY